MSAICSSTSPATISQSSADSRGAMPSAIAAVVRVAHVQVADRPAAGDAVTRGAAPDVTLAGRRGDSGA